MPPEKKILTLRNKQWSKKINKRIYYFGQDYDRAVERYEAERQYIEAGLPVPVTAGCSLGRLLNEFLADRRSSVLVGDLAERTFRDLDEVCDMIAEVIPTRTPLTALQPEHFLRIRDRLGKGVHQPIGPTSLNRRLGYARQVFRFASVDNHLTTSPLPYTRALRGVAARTLRGHRVRRKKLRQFAASEIRMLLEAAEPYMRAMILLGINGGMNNSDIAHLPLELVSPACPETLVYPRRKTQQERMIPLWPETRAAIDEYRDHHRPRREIAELFVMPRTGGPYFDHNVKYGPISKQFYRLLCKLKIYENGKNFGALRTTFANVAVDTDTPDDIAVKAIMGHVESAMLFDRYGTTAILRRCQPVVDRVRSWLLGVDGE